MTPNYHIPFLVIAYLAALALYGAYTIYLLRQRRRLRKELEG